jgi:hypothetical protein
MTKYRNDLEIAKAIASGDEQSPFHVELADCWLVDVRITGTGFAFRKETDSYVYRDKDIFTSEAVQHLCNGLPVIVNHGEMDDARQVGTVFYPFVRGDELRAVCKIFDSDIVDFITKNYVSTSPCFFSASIKFGGNIDIEKPPVSAQHLALLTNGELGVWDKMNAELFKSAIEIREDKMADFEDYEENESEEHETEEMARLKKLESDFGKMYNLLNSLVDKIGGGKEEAQAEPTEEEPIEKEEDSEGEDMTAPRATAADIVQGVTKRVDELNAELGSYKQALNMGQEEANEIATKRNDSSTLSRALLGIDKPTAFMPSDTVATFNRRHAKNLQEILKESGNSHPFLDENVDGFSDSLVTTVVNQLEEFARGLSRKPSATTPMIANTSISGNKTTHDRNYRGGAMGFISATQMRLGA